MKTLAAPGKAKVCSRCHQILPLDRFAWDGYRKDHRQATCKACKSTIYRGAGKDRVTDRTKANRNQIRKLSEEYRLQQGCVICGYQRCVRSLHFHHRDPGKKDFNISLAVRRNMSLEKVEAEMAKCIVLCSNCHGELHEGMITYE